MFAARRLSALKAGMHVGTTTFEKPRIHAKEASSDEPASPKERTARFLYAIVIAYRSKLCCCVLGANCAEYKDILCTSESAKKRIVQSCRRNPETRRSLDAGVKRLLEGEPAEDVRGYPILNLDCVCAGHMDTPAGRDWISEPDFPDEPGSTRHIRTVKQTNVALPLLNLELYDVLARIHTTFPKVTISLGKTALLIIDMQKTAGVNYVAEEAERKGIGK